MRQRSDRQRRLVLLLFIFLVAFLPRLSALGRYVTPDELNWVFRSAGLRQALLAQDWGATLRSPHPGVTTTWLGAVAIQIQLWLQSGLAEHLTWVDTLYWLGSDSVNAYRHLALFLSGGRLMVALVTSLGVAGLYLLGEKLVGSRAALLGALLVALDPFAAGLAGLLHVDGLLATFMLLALLLAILTRQQSRAQQANAIGAGIFTALALLTKTPAMLLLPVIGLILFPWPYPLREWARLRQLATWAPLLLWLLTTGVTALLLLPALWAAPRIVAEMMIGLTGREVEALHPTFFLGDMTSDPGVLFYPVVLLFRLSPAVTLGLLLPPFAGLLRVFQKGLGQSTIATAGRPARRLKDYWVRASEVWRRAEAPGLRSISWLLIFSVLLLVLVTLVSKKYDRYALPSLMALTLVAGWGTILVTGSLPRRARQAAFLLPLLLQVAFLLAALPYPLLAYNWLAGGAAGAYRALPVGWGEESSEAARRVANIAGNNPQPALFASTTVSAAPFYEGAIYRRSPAYLTLLEEEDYLLVTAGGRQQPGEGEIEATLTGRKTAETIVMNGREQAWLYSGVNAADLGFPSMQITSQAYSFDRGPTITAGGAAFLPWPQQTLVAITWQASPETAPELYRLQLQIVDELGRPRASQEQPLLNDTGQPSRVWPLGRPQTVYYTQPIPPDMPPGAYRVVVHLFDSQGAQLGVFDGQGQFAGTAAQVAEVTASPPPSQPPLAIPHSYGNGPGLVGFAPLPDRASNGAPLTLDLWWQIEEPARYQLALSLGTAATAEPWPLDTRSWKAGQRYHIQPRWRLPVDLPAGRQPLRLQLLDAAGNAVWPAPVPLGEIEVDVRERAFSLPAGLDPLAIEAGNLAYLQGVAVTSTDQALEVNVIWQARAETDTEHTAFVHLLDEAGNVVAQVDRPLAPPATSWVPEQVIAESYSLPRPDGTGTYRIALGLYDPNSGRRLPLYADGEQLADDAYPIGMPAP